MLDGFFDSSHGNQHTLDFLALLDYPAVTQQKLASTIIAMSIHSRIKERREALGMSMQTLADLVGVSAWQTVQQWEREGGTAPKRERLAKVASALQTTPEELLLGSTSTAMASHIGGLASSLGISMEALKVAKAFDRIRSEQQRNAVIAQLVAFGVFVEKE